MKKMMLIAISGAVALQTAAASSSQRMALTVSPAVALAPALLTIRTTIAPNAENRMLRIEVDSESFLTSSEIPLNGSGAQRLSVLEVKGVPPGLYEVRAALNGTSGELATTSQFVRVAPAAGQNP